MCYLLLLKIKIKDLFEINYAGTYFNISGIEFRLSKYINKMIII